MSWFKKIFNMEPTIDPRCKDTKCNCAVEWYLSACERGMMVYTQDQLYDAINARLDPELNKYFCHCQPERLNEKTPEGDAKV